MANRTKFSPNRRYPTVPTVTADPRSHTVALQALIEGVNIGQRRAGSVNDSFVRVGELVDIGLIELVGDSLKLSNFGGIGEAPDDGNQYARQSGAWTVVSGGGGGIGVESDPIFTAHVAYSITAGDIANWDAAYGWGDHAAAGYLAAVSLDDLTDVVTTPYGGDPYWDDVVVLLEFEGTDGSVTFTDTSTSGRTWTANGNAQLDTAIAKVGTGSLLLDGTGDWISTVDSADLEIADNEFTLECWIYVAAGATSDGGTHTIANKRDSGTAEEFSFGVSGATGSLFFAGYSPADTIAVSLNSVSGTPGGVTIAEETWTHVAVSRVGSTVRLFIDGVEVDSTTSANIVQNAAPLYIGTDGYNTTRTFIGNIDQFRLTIGTGRYSTAFTPPTSPFPTALPDDYTPTDGQVLTYDSGIGLWIPQTPLSSPLTTKGDLWGFSTVNARLPVGADGYVLTADSAEGLGVKWAAASGGGGGGVLAPLDPRDYFYWEDHFNVQYVNFGSAGSNWDVDVSLSYTAAWDTSSDPDHPGVVKITTVTTNSGYIRIQNANSATTLRYIYAAGTEPLTMEWMMKTPAAPVTGLAEWYMLFGLRDTAAVSESIEFNLGVNGSGNLVISGRCATGGVVSSTSGLEMSPETWYLFKAVITSTAVDFYLDDTLIGTVTTNIPTVAMREQFVWGKSGTSSTAYTVYLDYVRMYKGLDEAIAAASAVTVTGGIVADGDPLWPFVVSLLQFNGADASTTIDDEKGNTWTASGDAQLDTAQFKFGESSLLLDGTGDYVSVPSSSKFQIGAEDCTVEAWVRPAAIGSTITIANKRDTASVEEFSFQVSPTGVLYFALGVSGTLYSASGVTALSADTWYHVAGVRRGIDLFVFLNGVLDGSGTLPAYSTAASTNTESLKVGRDGSNTTRDWNGWIDSFRFTKGVARYTEDFTPPTEAFPTGLPSYVVPSLGDCSDVDTTTVVPVENDLLIFDGTNWVPLHGDPYIHNTVGLLDCEGTHGDTSYTDLLGETWTRAGNAQIDSGAAKFGSTSMYFDGTGDYFYRAAASSNRYKLTDQDFTLEVFTLIPSSGGVAGVYISWYNASTSQRSFTFESPAATYVRFGYAASGSGPVTYVSTGALPTSLNDDLWHHIAVVRRKGLLKMFVDGVQYGSDHVIGNTSLYSPTSALLTIGMNQSGGFPIAGYIDAVRYTVGVARYWGNFTVPTEMYPQNWIQK